MRNIKSLYLLSCIISVCWLCCIFYLNELPVDPADGLMHFFISQASWSHPGLFLDHWGKPLFILLSSPFAQFGFTGMFVFNLLVYISICSIAFKLFLKYKVNLAFAALFPVLILLADDFSGTILGGLTEPLFNLGVILSFWFFVEKKWLHFTLLISLIPYLRSEGQLVLLLGIIVLIFSRKFKFLPLLLIFPFIYSIAGLIVYNDFWWYFTKSAYSYSNNIYGKGNWNHYLISYPYYLGYGALFLFLCSFPVIIYFFIKRDWRQLKFPEVFYAYGIFIGIVVFHSYLWANGKYGSLGLTRIATQGMPLAVVLSMYYSGKLVSQFKLRNILFFSGICWCFYTLFHSEVFPVKTDVFDRQVILAGNFLNKYKSKLKTIHYHHPLLAYQMAYNPLIDKGKMNFYYGQKIELDFDRKIKKGDLLVWDSKFGPVESGMPLDKISGLKQLSLVNSFSYLDLKNKESGVHVYQYANLPQKEKRFSKVMAVRDFGFLKKDEFIDVYLPKVQKSQDYYAVNLTKEDDFEVYLVCTNENNRHYQCKTLLKGVNDLEYTLLPNTKYKFYFWNPSKSKSIIRINSFEKFRYIYPKIKLD